MQFSNVSILGDGAMGTACALQLAQRPHPPRVILWSARAKHGLRLQAERENLTYLPGPKIPPAVHLTIDLDEALSTADLLIVAVPMTYLRATLEPLQSRLRRAKAPLAHVVKGIEVGTFLRPSQLLLELFGTRLVGVISGPGHAEEIVRGQPTSLVVASSEPAFAEAIQRLFSGRRFRLYTNGDLIGVEMAGALKNIIALAAGVTDGLGFGDNAKAALMTRALVEMARFGVAHQGRLETFYGLAGVGDLITTCFSPHGRNRWVGEQIGRGRRLDEVLASTSKVAEGVQTVRSVQARARELRLEMPLTNEVFQMLFEGKPPLQALEDLMARELKSEA